MEVTKWKFHCQIEIDVKNTLPSHFGVFIFSKSKRIMNTFIREINGLQNSSIYYTDTDSLYIEKRYWDVLDKAKLVGKELCQGKKVYKNRKYLHGFFQASKKNIVKLLRRLVL